MKKSIKITAAVALNASEAGKPRRFNIVAYNGGLLPIDGFEYPVVVDLQGLTAADSVSIVLDHTTKVETTVGSTDTIQNDGRSLVLGGPITGDHLPLVKSAIQQHDKGQKWQASIGALVTEEQKIPAGQQVTVNGQTFEGPIIVARRSELRHTGILPSGADSSTSVNLAAKAAQLKGNAMTFEEWCAQQGIDPMKLTEAAKAAMMQAYDAEVNGGQSAPPAEQTPAPAAAAPAAAAAAVVTNLNASIQSQIEAGQKALAANLRKNAEIQAKASRFPMIAAKAIEEGWSVDKVELEVLKASQGDGRTRPTSFRNAEKDLPQGEVLEAAICMMRRHKDVEKAYKPEVLQAAHSQFRSRIGLQQAIILAAAANGYHASPGERIHGGNIADVLAFSCPDARTRHLHAAAFSTVSLPGILSNVANKEILQGYLEEDNAWMEISKRKSVSDFKQATSYRMLDDMEYEELGPGGAIKGGSLGEESYTRQAKTYARMFILERTQIINDDGGAFDDLRDRVGRGSAKKLNKVFWTKYINNSTFFTSGLTNYISGSTTNLGTDGVGLGLGVTQFRKMTSPTADGTKRVGAGMRPEILLVPPELEHTADKLYVGANLNVGTAAGEENTFRNKYRPVTAWQLSDSNYTGYSTTAWYLLANPQVMPTIVVSFLDGVETPTVESADADFNRLGIQFRGYHDFGVDTAEYLGGLKSKGAA